MFDIKVVAKTLNMKEEDVLNAYGSLMAKRIISVKAEKDGFGKIRESVSLDNFYNEINNLWEVIQKIRTDIYNIIRNN